MMENNQVYCPIFLSSDAFEKEEGCVCRKENCAWWVEDKQSCAVKALATILGRKK